MQDAVFFNLLSQVQFAGFYFTLEDEAGAWLQVSDSLAAFLGYRPDQFPQPLNELVPDPKLQRLSLTLTQSLLAGRPGVKHTLQVKCKTGELYWLEFAKSLVQWEGQTRIVGMGCDVTLSMEEMAVLRYQAKRLDRLVAHSPEILYRFSPNLGIQYVSQAFESALGYSRSQIEQNPLLWRQSIHPEDLPKVDLAFSRFQERVPYDLTYRIKDFRGEWHYFHDRNLIFENDHNEMVVEGIAIDVTKEKKAELELEARLAKIQHLEQLKSNFLAIMNHELRTPLNGIIGLAALLKQRNKDLQEDLMMIEECGLGLLSVVESVMDSNKLLENRYQTLISCNGFQSVFDKLGNLYKPAALAKGIILVVERQIPPDQSFCTDWLILEKIVGHLLSNAIKFSDQGQVLLRCRNDAKGVLLEVIDHGPGMDEATLKEHFQLFDIGEEPLTRNHRGVGLGLYLVQKLSKLIHAQITYSRLAPGSHFTLTLPPLQMQNQPQTAAPSLAGLNAIMQVLVVDDDLANRMILKGILSPLVKVHLAESGEQALEFLQQQPINLVFLDFMMPKMDGFEVATQIRILEIEGTLPHHTILVGVSAFLDADTKQKALDAGMDAVVSKPFKYEAIQEIIKDPSNLIKYA